MVSSVVLYNNETRESAEMEVDGVFIEVGRVLNLKAARSRGLELDEKGYIVVDARQRTNLQGVYTTGDVTICPYKWVVTAIGHAVIAAVEAYGCIRRTYYYRA